MANLINVERVTVGYGTRTLLDAVSLGVDEGDAIGVVGRNGDGKTTLLQVLTGVQEPGLGPGHRTRSGLSVGYLRQADDFAGHGRGPATSSSVDGRPDHIWAAEPEHPRRRRAPAGRGRPRRRRRRPVRRRAPPGGAGRGAAGRPRRAGARRAHQPSRRRGHRLAGRAPELASTRTGAASWSATTAGSWTRCAPGPGRSTTAVVDAYDGGYAAYVLARAERMRVAAGTEARRQNLMRKELAWLRRGPPARTSKPKFRIEAANELIANEPPPRDSLVAATLCHGRLGKDVFDLHRRRASRSADRRASARRASTGRSDRVTASDWSASTAPARRRCCGCSTGELQPTAGTVKRGQDTADRLPEPGAHRDRRCRAGARRRREIAAGSPSWPADARSARDTLLKDFGFTGDKLTDPDR